MGNVDRNAARSSAERWGLRIDELELDGALHRSDACVPLDGGTIAPEKLCAAAEAALEQPGREVRAVRSRLLWRPDFVTFRCRKLPGAEDTDLRAVVVVSIARTQADALTNLTQAMRAIQANPDELVVGNRMHGPVRGGYGIACLFLPGTRRPLGDAEPTQSPPATPTRDPAPGTRGRW